MLKLIPFLLFSCASIFAQSTITNKLYHNQPAKNIDFITHTTDIGKIYYKIQFELPEDEFMGKYAYIFFKQKKLNKVLDFLQNCLIQFEKISKNAEPNKNNSSQKLQLKTDVDVQFKYGNEWFNDYTNDLNAWVINQKYLIIKTDRQPTAHSNQFIKINKPYLAFENTSQLKKLIEDVKKYTN